MLVISFYFLAFFCRAWKYHQAIYTSFPQAWASHILTSSCTLSSHQLPVRNTKARHLNRFLLISPSQGQEPMLKLCLRDYWFSILSSAGSFLRWFNQSIPWGQVLDHLYTTILPNSNPFGSDGFEPCGREEWTPFVTVEWVGDNLPVYDLLIAQAAQCDFLLARMTDIFSPLSR